MNNKRHHQRRRRRSGRDYSWLFKAIVLIGQATLFVVRLLWFYHRN